MLSEYALIPDVFDHASYASAEECDQRLRELKECITTRGIVRNLHGGNWWKFVDGCRGRWHKRGLELLKKLKQQGRLSDASCCSSQLPEDGATWCVEALASHAQVPLAGIVADQATASAYQSHNLVTATSVMNEQTWWLGGKNSIQLKRSKADYVTSLGPTLRHSNFIMFIDPHLDAERPDYASFSDLLSVCGPRSTVPRIEIHRVCTTGSGKDKRVRDNKDWERSFRSVLEQVVHKANLQVEVFLWDDFHDRYLISNLIGILMPNGFDTEEKNPSVTRWARLDRDHRDCVEREFDPASGMHQLRHRFSI